MRVVVMVMVVRMVMMRERWVMHRTCSRWLRLRSKRIQWALTCRQGCGVPAG